MSNTSMKQLDTQFNKWDADFRQLQRKGDVALFERKSPQGSVGYEVIRVRKYPSYERTEGVTIEAHEAFPPSESWGDEGWTYNDAQDAQAKFEAEAAANPYTSVQGVPTGEARGRKRAEFEIEVAKLPKGEFTMKDVQALHPDRSAPFLHLRVNELIEQGTVKLVEKRKIPGARGKAPNIYALV